METGGLIGLILGMITASIGLYVGRKQAEKKRALDELHEHVWQKARSVSWYITTATIYILLFLVLIGITISAIKVLSILLIVHLFSWAVAGSYVQLQLASASDADAQIYKFLISFFVLLGIGFIIISLIVI